MHTIISARKATYVSAILFFTLAWFAVARTETNGPGVLFIDNDLIQKSDTTGLYFNAAEDKLGIATQNPSNTLTVQGTATISGGLGLGIVPAPKSALTIENGRGPAIDVRSPTYSNQTAMALFKQPDGMVKAAVNAVGAYYTNAWVVISGKFRATQDAQGNLAWVDGFSGLPAMLDVQADTPYGIISQAYNADGGTNYLGLDRRGKFTYAVDEDGTVRWGAGGVGKSSLDTSLRRAAPGTLATPGSLAVSGNVGVGIANPLAPLHVVGNVRLEQLPETNTAPRTLGLQADGSVVSIPMSSAVSGGGNSSPTTLTLDTADTDVVLDETATGYALHLPDAGPTARGVVTTGAQTFAGEKTFTSAPKIAGAIPNALMFANTLGSIAQDPSIIWLSSSKQMLINTATPRGTLTIGGVYPSIVLGNAGAYQILDTGGVARTVMQLDQGNNIHVGTGVNSLYFRTAANQSTRFLDSTTTKNLMRVFDNGVVQLDKGSRLSVGIDAPTYSLDTEGSVRVGTSTIPKGIMLYDEVTKAPYCITVRNGTLTPTAGACVK